MKNKRYTKKRGGMAFFNSLWSSKPSIDDSYGEAEQPTQLKPQINKLSSNLDDYSKQIEKNSEGVSNINDKLNTLNTVVGTGMAISAITGIGFGLPLAGTLAGVLILANTITYYYVGNLALKTVVLDVIIIISYCYMLYKLIELIQHQFKIDDVDDIIKNRINDKLVLLIKLLLNIVEDKILNELKNNIELNNIGFNKIINDEIELRKKGIFKSIGQFKRMYNRTFNFVDLQNNINNQLTSINSYFIIFKSQFDMKLDHVKRSYDIKQWNDIWINNIEQTTEYKNFVHIPKIEEIKTELDKDTKSVTLILTKKLTDIETQI